MKTRAIYGTEKGTDKKMKNVKELSKKNPYYLPKARRLELKYFCMQYPQWQAEYNGCVIIPGAIAEKVNNTAKESTVELSSEKRADLKAKMDLIIDCANKTDEIMGKYVFCGATSGLSYDKLWKKMEIPMCRSQYYVYCQKFFWILDHAK